MKKSKYDQAQVHELLYQALETELRGVRVYETALMCAQNEDLRKEWSDYLEQTRAHVLVASNVLESLGLDAEAMTPGREVVAYIGKSLVRAMEMALETGDRNAAELVACECIVLAETKDHANWELIGHVAVHGTGEEAKILKAAYESVEDDEDRHLYHTAGWRRELWLQSLGFAAVLPPPEEIRQVETAIGASRAEKARDSMLRRNH